MSDGDKIQIELEPNVDKFVSSISGKLAAIGAAVGAAFAFDKIISEAVQAEDALQSFETAARNAGQNVGAASERVQKLAEEMQKFTTVEGDAIVQNSALLVSVGRLSGEGLDRATKAAVNLSALLGKDLGTSFDIVAKATEGNVAALKKYGLEVSNSASKADKFNETLKFIESFGNVAASKVNTFSGALAQLKNNFGDVLENIGKMIIKSPVVIELLKFMSQRFADAAKSIESFSKNGDVFGGLVKSLLAFNQGVITYVVAPLELAYNVGKILFLGLQTGIAGFVAGVQAIQSAIFTYITKPIVDLIAGPLGKLVSFFDQEAGTALTQSIIGQAATMSEAAKLASEAATETFVEFADKTNAAIDNVFNFDASTKASDFVTQLQVVANAAVPVAQAAGQGIKQGIKKGIEDITFSDILAAVQNTANKIKFTADDLAKNLITTFQTGVGQAFAALGGALVSGKNAFEEFGKAVLRSLGQILIQLGGMMIVVGATLSTVPFLFGLQGPAAIAGGIAASIAGGVLVALGGGGGGTSSVGGAAPTAGGGVAETAPIRTPEIVQGGGVAANLGTTDLAQVEKKVGPDIHINVEGNILDRRDTGLEIAEIIRESFGGNAVVFT